MGFGGSGGVGKRGNEVLDALLCPGQGAFIALIGDPDVEPRIFRQLDPTLQCVERDWSEAEACGGGLEEVVAVRVFDQMLPCVFDRCFIRALAAEVMRQIERTNDLIEELRVTFDRLGNDRTYPKKRLTYSAQSAAASAGTISISIFSVRRIAVIVAAMPSCSS